MASTSCILQKLISFSGNGILSVFMTSVVLFLSAIIFSFLRQKNEEETVMQEEEQVLSQSSNNDLQQALSKQQCSLHSKEVHDEEDKKVKTESTTTIFQEKSVQDEGVGGVADQIHRDLYSESESIDDQSSSCDQDSDIDWSYSGNLSSKSRECSDGSISDEESLIEIALPSGHYVGGPKEDPKFSLQQKFQDFSDETEVFHQHSIKQLFAELNDMNEEENLIEIDLSMGSIKCSRFEIEA